MEEERKTPAEFMRSLFGKRVHMKLTNNEVFHGKLVSLDGALNVVLEQAQEYSEGGEKLVKRYSEIFLRGNNVLYINKFVPKQVQG